MYKRRATKGYSTGSYDASKHIEFCMPCDIVKIITFFNVKNGQPLLMRITANSGISGTTKALHLCSEDIVILCFMAALFLRLLLFNLLLTFQSLTTNYHYKLQSRATCANDKNILTFYTSDLRPWLCHAEAT